METLSKVQVELAGYCTSDAVIQKSSELTKKLADIVKTILERNEFNDVSQYFINPPKDFIAKLKMVASHGRAKFIQAHNSMVGKIRQAFSLAIEAARKAPFSERSMRIRSLNYA
ncbi:unnamed protein product [Rotaria sp. Silwood2]|nr:unnamed protein product [Rotaria sp. Silwood2]